MLLGGCSIWGEGILDLLDLLAKVPVFHKFIGVIVVSALVDSYTHEDFSGRGYKN